MLTPEQRYWQAMRKARIICHRSIEKLMRGEIGCSECQMDLERQFVIAEIAKAFELGKQAALTGGK